MVGRPPVSLPHLNIAEFLNNIRWSIYDYLRPECVRAYRRKDDELLYTFDVPATVADGLPRGMYWRLMHVTRQEPCFPRFVVAASLKAEF